MAFDPKTDLKLEVDSQGLGRRVTCLPCAQLVFSVSDNPTDAERVREGKALAAHLEFSHDMVAFYGRCRDPLCGRYHLSAFPKDRVPPEFKNCRSQE